MKKLLSLLLAAVFVFSFASCTSDVIEKELEVEETADGYVLKDSGSDILKRAIRVVHQGEQYIEPILMPRLRERIENNKNPEKKEDKLSKREFEILKLVAVGMYNKEIADQLSISEKTVKNHMSSIFRKIKVSDRTQAAVYAIRNNYVRLD